MYYPPVSVINIFIGWNENIIPINNLLLPSLSIQNVASPLSRRPLFS